ncbi:MAG TPA: NADH-quinone oxidoreductase subunit L [Actinomycetes bacterium]|nr:NADH-quinone oxidoreductase subunit L [Actinomycetes bacterium]
MSATGAFSLTWLLVALPLLGAAVLLLGGRRTDRFGHLLGCATVLVAFVIGCVEFAAMLGRSSGDRSVTQHLYTWIPVGTFHVDVGFTLDQLSMVFVLLITGVGSLIHIYSIGYMAHDPDRRRFFAYLNLFVASMLLLVLADSYLTLYVGWEGVGLASYLLIGFWNENPTYAAAAKKAFVVNRVGDMGLSIAIMVMFATFGTVSIAGVSAGASQATSGALLAMGLLLLLGACGKSAQVPLQSWLGDAMAGPTPVSALIHAATMVTAGVYLIARSSAIYDASHGARIAVVTIGTVTLLFGAIIGCAKDDIKKALAASTMSQIGYMFLAAGLGPAGYAFAIAHLLAHGFFKADMFLGAGSVMHGMGDETDMRRFGGLRIPMALTFWTFVCGWLAIIGVPPFSGFFTKDKIIEAGLNDSWLVGLLAMLGAAITAFYMSRLVFMTFFGERRWESDRHPHESPAVMMAPVTILAAGSVVIGGFLILNNRLVDWLAPVVGTPPEGTERLSPAAVSVITLVLVAGGLFLAWQTYGAKPVPITAPAGGGLTRAARQDLYGDAFNEAVFMRPGQYLTRLLVFFDNRVVDGAVNGLAALIGGISGRVRRFQTGFVRTYALSMFAGAAIVVAAVVLVRI